MGIKLTAEGKSFFNRRILAALQDPEKEAEMRRIAAALGLDLDKVGREVAEEDLRRAATTLGIAPHMIERLITRTDGSIEDST